ncbi:class I mannose-6-phosphate isomerase [Niabella insulamsoli]|uniref:class I mannose-6-phosphate isomerase n=1 Tax=Niabella insulamsoli TaxID=3144874 RepID=UPI0031FDAAF8
MIEISNDEVPGTKTKKAGFRKSLQAVLPIRLPETQQASQVYNIYPSFSLGKGKIFHGYQTLAQWMAHHDIIFMDGFSGVLWHEVQSALAVAFHKLGKTIQWVNTEDFLKSPEEIETMVSTFMGARDSVWGTKTDLQLVDYFHQDRMNQFQKDGDADCLIVWGPGAALFPGDGPVIYLDVPKNEVQYRMRAGAVHNLGMAAADAPAHMYKQYYFVDWVVLAKHRENIDGRIAIQADVQWQKQINWMLGEELAAGLDRLSETVLRVRPWFEAGAWGGQWMKDRIPGLNKDEVNYAWSFELIVPENGLVFESDGYLLEVPFDLLISKHYKKILGRHADFFGKEFPIRFDFLDTWEGGNLSIQCHPSLGYIREHFGEHITQDETYYILDCKPEAQVYLGFQEGVDPQKFRQVLEDSKANGTEITITDYVQTHTAQKHDLFLIPNGTIHSAGADNLVLEISSTPYIFTFKMYDWLRLDLDGTPRAINIEHAFKNLNFERQGSAVKKLIAQPVLIEQSEGAKVWHLPTHEDHFYDVHRLEFEHQAEVATDESCHVLMLVEGAALTVQIGDAEVAFHYAETFVIPAAVKKYKLINQGAGTAKVVKAFIKKTFAYLP